MPAETQLLFLVAIMAIFWLLMIRPARKAQRAQQELHASLEVGDDVVLNSGIFGTITTLEDNTLGLEVAPGTVLKVARQVVVRRVEDDPEGAAEAPRSAEPTTPADRPAEEN